MNIKKLLVANRGEIAVRVIRACRELGLASVAVYSEVDEKAPHALLADEAVLLGPASPRESYLNIDAIIEAARQTGAEAVHPGYGFLAENSLFAERLQQAGLTFVGPPAAAIKLMGDKLASRRSMMKAGVPVVPGTDRGDPEAVMAEAEKLGFPVMVKASAGGGGKGMRMVARREDLEAALAAASREAQAAFGDPTVYVEKLLTDPRHIEFQVLADAHGSVVHLFERECSIQRRHQKLVEETPSTAITPELRQTMGEAAVRAARAAGYVNAGTVEFMLDGEGKFYFLEMNTRIQVEHPITEMTTGVDLVAWQIRIASGEKLPFKQQDLRQTGHAIECRVYAEDASSGFLPSPGPILYFKEPTGPGVRNDCGVNGGSEVTMDYDPILSKLVTWGEDREAARLRMIQALGDYVVLGIKSTIPFLIDVMKHDAFINGDTTTAFIPTYLDGWSEEGEGCPPEVLAAACIKSSRHSRAAVGDGAEPHRVPSPWQILGAWEIAGRIEG
jgi:acetyl-CoA carboxylase biotin carboxylase subunit